MENVFKVISGAVVAVMVGNSLMRQYQKEKALYSQRKKYKPVR